MGYPRRNKNARRLTISAVLAISLLLVLTAIAAANSETAVWSGGGEVLYVGPSMEPSIPTITQSEFKIDRRGRIRLMTVKTTNEMFIATIGSPTKCRDRRGSNACERLAEMLATSGVTSLHQSTATLSHIVQSEVQVPLGGGILNVPVLSGGLTGRLEGVFSVGTATGGTEGTTSLRIGRGSTGTYACFVPDPALGQLVPQESLEPCTENLGGMMFPIALSVTDTGKFELGPGFGSMEDLLGVEGRVVVKAQANLLLEQVGGKIEITKATATLTGAEEEDDSHHGSPWNSPVDWNAGDHGKFDRSDWAEKFQDWKDKLHNVFANHVSWNNGNGWSSGRGASW